MDTYKLDLKKGDYITQRKRKLFKYALQWCLENNWNCCKVNRTYYNFDFDKLEVQIRVGNEYTQTYKIKKVK